MNINNKTYLTALIIVLALFTIVNFSSCDNTEPEKIKSLRDYTWTVDTVYNQNNFQTLMSSVWGSSENDIYMCGHSSNSPGGLWHYNGEDWQVVNLTEEVGHSALIKSVSGSSATDVWVVGYNTTFNTIPIPYIIQFNGFQWKKHELNVTSIINSVYVENQNNVWLCGSNGIIAHFDGTNSTWQIDTLTNPINNYKIFDLRKIVGSVNKKYILSTIANSRYDSLYISIFQLSNQKWELLDFQFNQSGSDDFGVTDIFYSKYGKLYTVGPYFYEYEKDWDKTIVDFFTSIWTLYAYEEDNILIAGNEKAYHFNGNNWQLIDTLTNENVLYKSIWMNDNTAVIIGNLDNKTIVMHGK